MKQTAQDPPAPEPAHEPEYEPAPTEAAAAEPDPATEPEAAGHVIARLARQVELSVQGFGLSFAQYRMLAILGDGGRAAASKLAEVMSVSRPTVTGVVDGLVARGLVSREAVDGDRRRVDVVLTEAGKSLISAADNEVQRRIADLRALFGGSQSVRSGPGEPAAGDAPGGESGDGEPDPSS